MVQIRTKKYSPKDVIDDVVAFFSDETHGSINMVTQPLNVIPIRPIIGSRLR